MKNIALIFAGGTGSRMSTRALPKQFLELNGKPIIIHTLEHFEFNDEVDAICVVCLKGWEQHLRTQMERFGIKKVKYIVEGGATGQESIFNGLKAVYEKEPKPEECLMLMHDGVRPLINSKVISDCIECAREHGSAVTVTSAYETIITTSGEGSIENVVDRSCAKLARAPQCYFLSDIYTAHLRAQAEAYTGAIDSATLMRHYGKTIYTVEGPVENIKITTASDFFMARAIIEARENSQIFG